MRYPAVIHKDENTDFGVMVPDIPGCYSAGETYDEALNNAREAIECHLEGLLLDSLVLPVATAIDFFRNLRLLFYFFVALLSPLLIYYM